MTAPGSKDADWTTGLEGTTEQQAPWGVSEDSPPDEEGEPAAVPESHRGEGGASPDVSSEHDETSEGGPGPSGAD